MRSYSAIQQAFVHRYMDIDGVIGVRVQQIEGTMTLVVQVEKLDLPVQMPTVFEGLPVGVQLSRRAVLAYC
jgi:hypothetical protein